MTLAPFFSLKRLYAGIWKKGSGPAAGGWARKGASGVTAGGGSGADATSPAVAALTGSACGGTAAAAGAGAGTTAGRGAAPAQAPGTAPSAAIIMAAPRSASPRARVDPPAHTIRVRVIVTSPFP